VNHLDATGQVRVSALADLVAPDRDPFEGPPEAITEA
jgi:predicted amidohydrolase YtcJ